MIPNFHRRGQPSPKRVSVSFIQRHGAFAFRGDDIIILHEEHVHVGRDDLRAVAIAFELAFDLHAFRIQTAEETIQLHVVLLRIYHDAVGLGMTEHQLAEVCAMS